MVEFVHETLGQRVVFCDSQADAYLAREIEALGVRRVVVISGRADAEEITAGLRVVLRWDKVVEHVPLNVADEARAAARHARADVLIAIGGGSAIGLAKAIALEQHLPIIAVPTTFAGSEATDVWGVTEGGRKTTGVDRHVLPKTVIYDAELTAKLSREFGVASAINGIAHCVDSLWAPRADPLNAIQAQEAARSLADGIRAFASDPSDAEARHRLQYGAYLAAVAFASAGSGMHHKLCHVLGGTYDLPHAQTHAVVLPYVLAYNMDAAPDAARRLETAFGEDDALLGLERLKHEVGAPTALRHLGFERSSIPEAAMLAAASVPPTNPRPVSIASMTTLLESAWSGTSPEKLRSP